MEGDKTTLEKSSVFAQPFWVWIVIFNVLLPILIYLVIKLLSMSKEKAKPLPVDLRNREMEKDVVYLCSFARPTCIPDLSPFGLKVETWLRIAGIKYERIEDGINGKPRWSKKGQMPYVFLNGEEIADSGIIILRLQEHFNKNLDEDLTVEQRCASQAFMQMVEHHTVMTYFWFRYVDAYREFWDSLGLPFSPFALWITKKLTHKGFKNKGTMVGIGRHPPEDQKKLAQADLLALSGYLGDKKFFMGDKPSKIDAVLFGHLGQILYIPINYPHRKILQEQCRNLIHYVDRMKAEFYPDWEELLTRNPHH